MSTGHADIWDRESAHGVKRPWLQTYRGEYSAHVSLSSKTRDDAGLGFLNVSFVGVSVLVLTCLLCCCWLNVAILCSSVAPVACLR